MVLFLIWHVPFAFWYLSLTCPNWMPMIEPVYLTVCAQLQAYTTNYNSFEWNIFYIKVFSHDSSRLCFQNLEVGADFFMLLFSFSLMKIFTILHFRHFASMLYQKKFSYTFNLYSMFLDMWILFSMCTTFHLDYFLNCLYCYCLNRKSENVYCLRQRVGSPTSA